MVTSNKVTDKKIVKMTEQNNSAVVPQRTLLGEVNEHITCPLCGGYYIDATTIVECLHSFCRSCIIKHLQLKSYCPVCEMMINAAKPNIKLDKALQDIVYKLVPGLFQKEMERRQQFYASRPGPAASATPEQRGEDTERIIFSPEDVISFSLEYADATDADSISSKSSDSNEPQNQTAPTRRYLQCPAVVNISHLKKFLSMKFDIDSTQFAIDILYKRVPLPDYYTLMDIAYIYNWKRNEPMRFFYQIIDYVAIRNRLFDINRNGSHFPDRKSSPTSTEDTNVSSPAPNLNDQVSEASSGTDSPMPDDSHTKKASENLKKNEYGQHKENSIPNTNVNNANCTSPKKSDDEVEKSQFLNSFELTAKNSSPSNKNSPVKSSITDSGNNTVNDDSSTSACNSIKTEDTLKRKHQVSSGPEIKKLKIESEKSKVLSTQNTLPAPLSKHLSSDKSSENPEKMVNEKDSSKSLQSLPSSNTPITKDLKPPITPPGKQSVDNHPLKRAVPVSQNISSPKRKLSDPPTATQTSSTLQKTVSPIKLQLPKSDMQAPTKPIDCKPIVKKIPDLKPSVPGSQISQNKNQPVGKLRMDLLANNSDPTIDRSKILSQVKTSLSLPNTAQSSGDPLKSLFDSCKINIPSSLSITLTDQKLDPRNPNDINTDQKKNVVNKNLTSASNVTTHHTVPSPPVHNYIEILKLPDTDPKKTNKTDTSSDKQINAPNKSEPGLVQPKPNKPSENSAKGPVPNLKPIADTKLAKQSGNFSAPITFQQTFEQQLQSLQTEKKVKVGKNKPQVPKLVPATPKTFSAVNKLNNTNNKSIPPSNPIIENKPSTALDLSTPHNIQSQLGPQQTKAFETMQSIANFAKKQNLPTKVLPIAMSPSNIFSGLSNRPLNTSSTLRVPSTSSINQMKLDKVNTTSNQLNTLRQELSNKVNQIKQPSNTSPTVPSPNYQMAGHNSLNTAQPSPRQTRSPSSSPKLVIAEDKQANNIISEINLNQSSQITSTQIPNINATKNETPKISPGPSKPVLKPVKPLPLANKMTRIQQPITPNMKPNPPPMNSPADYLSQPQLISQAHHAMLRQMEMRNAWLKAHGQYDLFKNMTSMAHQAQGDFNKDKQ